MSFSLPTLAELEAATQLIRPHVPETRTSHHGELDAQLGCGEIWLKHEHETPAGAFKVRGGIVYLDELTRSQPGLAGVIAASTGNHGRSIAWSSRRIGLPCTIVVPVGNPEEKNNAIRALGARLVEHGADFQSALEYSRTLAAEEYLHAVPSFHPWLVRGVATYALEFFRAAPPLDVVFVPIGLGSGAAGVIAARQALGLSTRVIGVVSAHAPAYALSLEAGKLVTHPTTTRIAEGVACSTPNADALSLLSQHLDKIVTITDEEGASAMRLLQSTTGDLIEGSAALALAAVSQTQASGRIGVILSGGNVSAQTLSFAGLTSVVRRF